MIIDFIDETELLKEKELQTIHDLLEFAGNFEKVHEEAEISITFVNDERIQEINKDFRNKDIPTDVISFALEEKGEDEIEIHGLDLPPALGDIIISIPRAVEQAERYNHSFIRELGFLSVHGFLHLLGYDHMNEEDEKKMFQRQREILDEYGLKR